MWRLESAGRRVGSACYFGLWFLHTIVPGASIMVFAISALVLPLIGPDQILILLFILVTPVLKVVFSSIAFSSLHVLPYLRFGAAWTVQCSQSIVFEWFSKFS